MHPHTSCTHQQLSCLSARVSSRQRAARCTELPSVEVPELELNSSRTTWKAAQRSMCPARPQGGEEPPRSLEFSKDGAGSALLVRDCMTREGGRGRARATSLGDTAGEKLANTACHTGNPSCCSHDATAPRSRGAGRAPQPNIPRQRAVTRGTGLCLCLPELSTPSFPDLPRPTRCPTLG